jgi:hypothetical protein
MGAVCGGSWKAEAPLAEQNYWTYWEHHVQSSSCNYLFELGIDWVRRIVLNEINRWASLWDGFTERDRHVWHMLNLGDDGLTGQSSTTKLRLSSILGLPFSANPRGNFMM